MAKSRKIPEIAQKTSTFCPGCGHGIAIRLITECLEELGQDKNVMFGIGVGCSSLLGGVLDTDRLHCLHGRASAVCTGMKRVSPDQMVISYQGDGDAYSIGLAETTSAAYRNENFTVFVINNTNFGMTGGQMSTTTLPGQKTTTTVHGRDCTKTGSPIKFPELVSSQFEAAYVARGAVTTPAEINKSKKYVKEALTAQLNGEGYSVVEILSPCPTNWGMTPKQSMDHIMTSVVEHFPLGEFKTREAK